MGSCFFFLMDENEFANGIRTATASTTQVAHVTSSYFVKEKEVTVVKASTFGQ